MTIKRVEIPPKLIPVFAPPRGELRYRGAYGGRGSGKSYTFAKMAAIWGAVECLRILCTRELQNSIKESFHAELKNAIASDPWLASCYDVGIDYIRGHNGTEFLFRGLRHSMGAIKSTAQIDLCIVEEAEDVPESAWLDLLPTIRAPKSEIWIVWNPKKDGSPTDTRFKKNEPSRSKIVAMNYNDNPWFPDELEEMRLDQRAIMEDAVYRHVWEGAYLKHGAAQIFSKKYKIQSFDAQPTWDGPYFGVDFGFAQDPTAAVRCYVADNRLYIDYEAGKVGLELDDTADYIKDRIPEIERHVSRADCARPESISYLKRKGLPRITGVEKGKGSVEDGIEFIKSFECVVIHPRCEKVAEEFSNYSYKVDRLSGDILPVPVDDWNHYIDALRYALQPLMKARKVAPIAFSWAN